MSHIDIIDMNVLCNVRLIRLDIDLCLAIGAGNEAFLHSIRNRECSMAVRAFHFCKIHLLAPFVKNTFEKNLSVVKSLFYTESGEESVDHPILSF